MPLLLPCGSHSLAGPRNFCVANSPLKCPPAVAVYLPWVSLLPNLLPSYSYQLSQFGQALILIVSAAKTTVSNAVFSTVKQHLPSHSCRLLQGCRKNPSTSLLRTVALMSPWPLGEDESRTCRPLCLNEAAGSPHPPLPSAEPVCRAHRALCRGLRDPPLKYVIWCPGVRRPTCHSPVSSLFVHRCQWPLGCSGCQLTGFCPRLCV